MTSTGNAPDQRSGSGANGLAVISCFFLLALLLRIASFHRSVIDWDESLYFLMAEAWRQGHLPYTTLWDNKPIGIYAIFAVFQLVFGDTIASMRLAAVVAVTATGYCLYRIIQVIDTRRVPLPFAAAILPGLLYLCGSIRNEGMSANTELFIAPFVSAAMLAALGARPVAARAYLAGFLTGTAVMVKYVAVFEAPAVFAALLTRTRPADRAKDGLLFLFGIATPLACAFLLYAANGHADLFVTASLLDNVHRLGTPFSPELAWHGFRDHAEGLIAGYLAALLLPAYLIAARMWGRPGTAPALLLLWTIGGLLGTASVKSFYDHYFLQPLPALCLAAVWLPAQFLELRGLRGVALGTILLLQPARGAWNTIVDTLHSTMMHSAMLFTTGYDGVYHHTNVAAAAITNST